MAKVSLGSQYGLGRIEISEVQTAFELEDRRDPDRRYRIHIYLKNGAILITSLIPAHEEASRIASMVRHLISENK
jgi:hypothetical protein